MIARGIGAQRSLLRHDSLRVEDPFFAAVGAVEHAQAPFVGADEQLDHRVDGGAAVGHGHRARVQRIVESVAILVDVAVPVLVVHVLAADPADERGSVGVGHERITEELFGDGRVAVDDFVDDVRGEAAGCIRGGVARADFGVDE